MMVVQMDVLCFSHDGCKERTVLRINKPILEKKSGLAPEFDFARVWPVIAVIKRPFKSLTLLHLNSGL